MGELFYRLKAMGEDQPTDFHVMDMVHKALLDAKVVIENLEQDDVDQALADPTWNYMSNEMITDPYEAFHFNVIEEVTDSYIRAAKDPTKPARGFRVYNNNTILLYY